MGKKKGIHDIPKNKNHFHYLQTKNYLIFSSQKKKNTCKILVDNTN